MSKTVLFQEHSRRLEKGIDSVANAVKVTLGPNGRNVVLKKHIGLPFITNDGVSIAKDIDLADPVENMGAQLLKEVANKTNDIAGDGTTTACVLAQAILREGLRNVAAGANPIFIKKGIDKAVNTVVEELKNNSIMITTKEAIAQVASISANDKAIGTLIADVISEVGSDGVITIEESKGFETTYKVVEGFNFDRGYVSPFMITDNDKREAFLDNAYILITDKTISAVRDILPIFEKILPHSKQVLIIAEDVVGEALATLNMNKMKGFFTCVAVRATGFGDRRKAFLQDVAALTGGQLISEEIGLKLENTTLEMLGRARRVKIGRDDTTIIDGYSNQEEIKSLLADLKKQYEITTSPVEKDTLRMRQTMLSGGIAVIKVGAATEVELKEKKMRFEDAVAATRAAVEEGIVPGGGTALINVIPAISKLQLEDDELTGANIVKKALEEPLRQIANNSGVSGEVVVETIKKATKGFGFNAATGQLENMIAAGIIDPMKVTRCALEFAASIAGMVLTTETIISNEPEKNVAAPCSCGHHGCGHHH